MKKQLLSRHLQLRNMLLKNWKTKGLKKNDKIESQNDIAKFCDFSLITIIKTLNDLQAEGIIKRKVGKGSYLNNAPWFTNHLRIGFFYNREVVGGGIFHNNFYTKVVVAFEKKVISDGHEFILGSFTHKKKPLLLWDDFDAVVLTGITKKTNLQDLNNTSCLLSFIDKQDQNLLQSNYRIDFEKSFNEMFKKNNKKQNKFLYLDSKIESPERSLRTKAFKDAFKNYGNKNTLKIISVDQENEPKKTADLVKTIVDFKPEFVCGYIHSDWYELINKVSQKEVKIYSPLLDEKIGFIVDSTEWMNQILPDIYLKLNDRKNTLQPKPYIAKFIS
ncbi:hypothetical protein OAK12_01425 [Alphaproteobacteria bacterium]|nr:hypothetical protein [Alphaproteobacteria bacterium]